MKIRHETVVDKVIACAQLWNAMIDSRTVFADAVDEFEEAISALKVCRQITDEHAEKLKALSHEICQWMTVPYDLDIDQAIYVLQDIRRYVEQQEHYAEGIEDNG